MRTQSCCQPRLPCVKARPGREELVPADILVSGVREGAAGRWSLFLSVWAFLWGCWNSFVSLEMGAMCLS